MSIHNYIQGRIKKFQDKRTAISTATQEDKEKALLYLREQRKKLEEQQKINEAITEEKIKIKELKKQELQRKLGIGGKVIERFKDKIRESKEKGNVFTQTTINPIFQENKKNPFGFKKNEE